ncbi:unnamed protein product, partial [Musa hybrid cultivar]
SNQYQSVLLVRFEHRERTYFLYLLHLPAFTSNPTLFSKLWYPTESKVELIDDSPSNASHSSGAWCVEETCRNPPNICSFSATSLIGGLSSPFMFKHSFASSAISWMTFMFSFPMI